MDDLDLMIRDEIYARIGIKKLATGFTNNNSFQLKRTWYPHQDMAEFADLFPNGIVYIASGTPGDMRSESRTDMTMQIVSAKIGVQIRIPDRQDIAAIDTHVKFARELTQVCRKEVDLELFQFMTLEYLKDDNGVPYSFASMRELSFFECYFTANYLTTFP